MDYWVGVDMGSHVDYSAVSVLVRFLSIDPESRLPRRNSQGRFLYDWRLRGLLRFPLRTPYTEVARKVASIAASRALKPQPRVVLDSTGVGTACVELIRTAMRPYPDIDVWGVSITSGESWRVVRGRRHEINCSKVQLIGAFREVLEMDRITPCKRRDGSPIRGGDVLSRELSAFKSKMSRLSDAEIMGADSGAHDDCVLSVSLPVWAGSLPFMQMRTRGEPADDKVIEEAEAEALALERGDEPETTWQAERQKRFERERLFHEDPDDEMWDWH